MQSNEFEGPVQIAQQIVVWDLAIRLFHWLLVLGVVAAYLTARFHYGVLHSIIGYGLIILLVARLIWGAVGTRFARFNSFIFSVRETVDYLRAIPTGKPRHYIGHNPAGALMVFALLAILSLLFLTGLLTLGAIDFDGPLIDITNSINDQSSYFIHHLHSCLVNIGMTLVTIHILGVLLGSYQHKENLIKAMFTGKKNTN